MAKGSLLPGRTKFQRGNKAPFARSKIRRRLEMDVSERDWFYDLRAELGISREELTERSGLHESSIEKWERLGYDPTLKSLRRIAKAYDMELWVEFRPKTLLGGLNGTTDEK